MYLLFILGFVFLIKGADLLVVGASSIAKRMRVSSLVVGLTIVSFGTSMPELIVNLTAGLKGQPEIAIGNILGSNVANILLVLGASALVARLPVKTNTILTEIPFSLTAALLVGFLANASITSFYDDDPKPDHLMLSRADGIVLLVFFFLFMAYIFAFARKNRDENIDVPPEEDAEPIKVLPNWRSWLYIGIGIVALASGGQWVVGGAVKLAETFGMSQSFVGLTIVAIGTSLPELVTSMVAAYKRQTDIAVGNVVGSNIFNILWILGLGSVVSPMPFDHLSNFDILMIIFSSTLLLLAMTVGRRREINWVGGVFFLLCYFGYITYLVSRG